MDGDEALFRELRQVVQDTPPSASVPEPEDLLDRSAAIPGYELREELHREKPWVAENIVKACEESKKWALSQMRFTGTMRYMVPWLNHEVEEVDALFGGDPYPYGIEPNRKTLETLMQYLVDQGFVTAPAPQVDDMFTPIVAWGE